MQGGRYLDLGVQEGERCRRTSLHRTPAFRASILVFVLLLSTSAVSTIGPFGTNSNHVAKDGAHTAAIDPSSVILAASPSTALVNDTITFYANASSDDPGAILTFTIFYDCLDQTPTINPESPVTVDTAGTPWSVVRTFAYNHPGNLTQGGLHYFWVFAFVSDGTDNYSAGTQVYVNSPPPPPVNEPPRFIEPPADPLNAIAGVITYILIKVADNLGDTVTVLWDFGDGTNATNVTVAPTDGIVLNQTHSWNPRIPGKGDYNQSYTLNVSLSDGLHPPVNSSTPVNIRVPLNWPPNLRLTASKSSASPLEPISFTANASDLEGDPLTWTFNYSDGTVEVYLNGFTAPGQVVWQNTTHSFDKVGIYTVNVSVSDAWIPFQVGDHNVTVPATIEIIANVAPFISATIDVDPGAPMINATAGYVNATISVEANDDDGDMFNLTWDMGEFGIRTNISVGDTQQRKDPYRYRQVLTFIETGSYTITVTVTDGRSGHEVRRMAIVKVSSNNRPPVVLDFYQSYVKGDFALVNQSVNFTLILTDQEHDAIELTWNFGDGSPRLHMNLTNYDSKGNITVSVNHSYARLGTYDVTIVLTDNKVGGFNHTLNYTLHIQVSIRPLVVIEGWTSWDYISLSIFAAIPALLMLWGYIGMHNRRKMEMSPSLAETESSSSIEGGLEEPAKKGHEEGG